MSFTAYVCPMQWHYCICGMSCIAYVRCHVLHMWYVLYCICNMSYIVFMSYCMLYVIHCMLHVICHILHVICDIFCLCYMWYIAYISYCIYFMSYCIWYVLCGMSYIAYVICHLLHMLYVPYPWDTPAGNDSVIEIEPAARWLPGSLSRLNNRDIYLM